MRQFLLKINIIKYVLQKQSATKNFKQNLLRNPKIEIVNIIFLKVYLKCN